MNEDNTFRLAIILTCLVFVPVGLYHRFRSATDEKLDRWQEGVVVLFGLRLTGLVMFVGGLTWLINPQWMAWSSLPLPVWLRWSGIGPAVIAGSLVAWTFHNLGRNLTDTVVTRKEHYLVDTGPYRWIRHPFYLAGALGMLGIFLAMANWFFLIAGVILLGFLFVRTRIEEEKLIERFGDEYRLYTQRVGRFLPRL